MPVIHNKCLNHHTVSSLLNANTKTNPNPDPNRYRRCCPDPNAMIQN